MSRRIAIGAIAGAALAVSLGGCVYDYKQHTDQVSYSAGNAVKANLESETSNPSHRSQYSTRGLGQDGIVAGASSEAPAD